MYQAPEKSELSGSVENMNTKIPLILLKKHTYIWYTCILECIHKYVHAHAKSKGQTTTAIKNNPQVIFTF